MLSYDIPGFQIRDDDKDTQTYNDIDIDVLNMATSAFTWLHPC